MNTATGDEPGALFGGSVEPGVAALIEAAKGAPRAQAGALLWSASLDAPACLPIYYLLYKLHAGQGELTLAQQAARRGLDAAARAAGLCSDWREVQAGAADFSQPGPARFWLFTLKALAFIHLRLGERHMAKDLVEKIFALDPDDQVGANVVRSLLKETSVA